MPSDLLTRKFSSKEERRKAIEARIAELEQKEYETLKKVDLYRRQNKIEFFHKPNPPQQRLIEAFLDPAVKVLAYTGGNRSGKTTIGIILALSVMFGELPWNKQPLRFMHKYPRKVRVVGQDWEKHVKTVIEPALDEWWPQARQVETRKNNTGVRAFWTDLKSNSTLEVLSNMSESDVAEGWSGDLVLYDEPPKRDMRVACARGLVDRQGKEIFTMTLLKEAWIAREVLKAVTDEGLPDRSVYVVNATIYDNIGYGITEEGVKQFEKTLTEEEKQARLLGIPSYMSNLIWVIDRNTHIKKPFKIPLDWIVDVQIDYHPVKPWAVLFQATAPDNRKYVIDEIWEHGNPKFIAEQIMRKVLDNHYRVGYIEIDPLAKGDSNNEETVYGIMSNVFASYGHILRTASKDKDNGITIIRNLLKTENEMPALFFFEHCKKTIEQCENWMTDKDTLKPKKEDDDFPECLYRHGLRNTQWFEPQEQEEHDARPARRNRKTGY